MKTAFRARALHQWVMVWGLLVAECVVAVGSESHAPTAPLVIGYERFARHDLIDKETAGRLLITELNCAACHRTKSARYAPRGGPRVDAAGIRLSANWLAQHLSNPLATKPGTTMPDVMGQVAADERAQVIADLLAFLQTQQRDYPFIKATGAVPVTFEFWNQGSIRNGRDLYHQVGCVACHAPDERVEAGSSHVSPQQALLDQLDPEELVELGLDVAGRPVPSIPLGDLRAKYNAKSLSYFLFNPAHTRSGQRMPNLRLLPSESADIAAYLLSLAAPVAAQDSNSDRPAIQEPASQVEDSVSRGAIAFTSLGCVQCHEANFGVSGIPDAFDAKSHTLSTHALEDVDLDAKTGCLSEDRGKSVNYQLDTDQIDAIRLALRTFQKELATPARDLVDQDLTHQLLALNCVGCHTREKLGGIGSQRNGFFETVGNVDLGDEGRLPPTLTGIGRKAKADWIREVVAGKKGLIRPHMTIRMPLYDKNTGKLLSDRFVKADRDQSAKPPPAATPSSAEVKAAQALMDLGCVQCHWLGGYRMPGVVGLDLANIDRRVNHDWFMNLLRDPSAVKPRTRMPNFFPDGKSQRPDLLGGEVDQQIEALWSYLSHFDEDQLPSKIAEARDANFVLKPTDRPILLRGFTKISGMHAIMVGHPEQVHYVLDTDAMALGAMWRGQFVDAQGTWFVRSTPPAEPLGIDVVDLPAGPDVTSLVIDETSWPAEDTSLWFDGYSLDREGRPTFRYHNDAFVFRESLRPQDEGIRRSIEIERGDDSPDQTHYFRVLAGDKLEITDEGVPTIVSAILPDGPSLRVHVTTEGTEAARRLPAGVVAVPLSATSKHQRIELRYQW